MQITAKIDGEGDIRIGLRKLGGALPNLSARVIKTYMEHLKVEVSAQYPAAEYAGYNVPFLPKQKYVRTGAYGAGFKVERNGPQNYTLSNRVRYASLVGGAADGSGQADVHYKRWPVVAERVEERISPLVDELDREIQTGAEAFGL